MKKGGLASAGFAIAAMLVACSSESGAGGASASSLSACPEANVVVAETREVSFATDVLPVFEKSCTFGACHGTAGGTNHGVYLGVRGGGGAVAVDAVHAALVNAKSAVGPMSLVTPGAPEESWLVRKLEGTTCTLDPSCSGGSCGERMPKGGEPLAAPQLAAIKGWIAQGAKKN
ncbi:MAG: hypothetical protein JST00_19405 [Deltaproteobacteria bacterium]|nr:hypothetical protein [Deltaproteobacteria bacterium]